MEQRPCQDHNRALAICGVSMLAFWCAIRSQYAALIDPETRALCRQIVASEDAEIAQIEAMLEC